MVQSADVVIVGGGIVGLATAYRLIERFPQRSVTVLEKEANVARHQTGRNSGVLHSGIYYQPGSLRAENCRLGKLAMQQFCQKQGIPFELCGKVIVATTEAELPQLQKIYDRGVANRVRCEIIGRERLRELEPHAAGVQAIHVPDAGIVDYVLVAEKLTQLITAAGSQVVTRAQVKSFRKSGGRMIVESAAGDFEAKLVVNCAGLHSDRMARLSGQEPPVEIVPFRGEYFELKPSAAHLCRGLIYPVPDPNFPFLGVHFTRMIHGGVECGPNAVLAFAREGYHKLDFNLVDFLDAVTNLGFRNLAWKNWGAGLGEMYRSLNKGAFVKALQKLVPAVREDQLITAPAGVRAQALWPDGRLVDDFLIQEQPLVINVLNAPSPAATASLNIGTLITDRIAART